MITRDTQLDRWEGDPETDNPAMDRDDPSIVVRCCYYYYYYYYTSDGSWRLSFLFSWGRREGEGAEESW